VLEDLGGQVDTKKELVNALIENCNITDKTARNAIDRAEEFDKVKTIKTGRSIAVEIVVNEATI
jgi:nucleoid DNA-binding protein